MDGPSQKLAGIDRISDRPEGAPWRVAANARLLELARTGEAFTSEDITAQVGQPSHPNAVGALLSGAARRGWIERLGFAGAERPNQHSALISRWRGIAAKLPRGQAEIPEIPEVSPLRPGAPRVELSSWRCAACRLQLPEAQESYLTPTLSPSVRMGRCPSCGKKGTFTR